MLLLMLLPFMLSPQSRAHQAHQHHGPTPAPAVATATTVSAPLAELAAAFEREVRPIFTAKCMDCHSDHTRYPWYYQWPVARQLIDRDVREAKSHINMTPGFPFQSHGTPKEDLEAIGQVIKENSMPPWRYRWLHRESALTDTEKEAVLKWISEGLKHLQ